MSNRRKLIIALGAGALAAPFVALAQQGKVWRVGFLSQRARPDSLDFDIFSPFAQGMRELGYIEGKNLIIEWRFADGKYERLTSLAAELVQSKVDVIVTAATLATGTAHKATTVIPIVMLNVGDPIGSGFIKSLAHPGGNVTGLTNIASELVAKQLEMLLSVVPRLARVAVLVNPANPSELTIITNLQAAAQKTNVKVLPVEARTPEDIPNAFSLMALEKTDAVIVSPDALFVQRQRQVAELAAKYRLPSISARRENVEVGYLIGYGPNTADIVRRAATYVDKILKGAKPADLPVEQPTKFELFINGKTARALGLTIPQSLLISAEKVIE